MKKDLLVIAYIAMFSIFSYFCNENELNQKWWENATVADVEERFKHYKHLRYKDSAGRTLLHLACLYSKDSAIPEYFIWRGIYLVRQDRKGNTSYDYAVKNPHLTKFAQKMKILENVDYLKRLKSLYERGVDPNIDLLIPVNRNNVVKSIIPNIHSRDAVVFKYYKTRKEKIK